MWAPLVRGVEIDARTARSPANREVNSTAGGIPCTPAILHTNACFPGEVQSVPQAAALPESGSEHLHANGRVKLVTCRRAFQREGSPIDGNRAHQPDCLVAVLDAAARDGRP